MVTANVIKSSKNLRIFEHKQVPAIVNWPYKIRTAFIVAIYELAPVLTLKRVILNHYFLLTPLFGWVNKWNTTFNIFVFLSSTQQLVDKKHSKYLLVIKNFKNSRLKGVRNKIPSDFVHTSSVQCVVYDEIIIINIIILYIFLFFLKKVTKTRPQNGVSADHQACLAQW